MISDEKAISDTFSIIIGIGVAMTLTSAAIFVGYQITDETVNSGAPNTAIDFDYNPSTDTVIITKGSGKMISPDNTGKLRVTGNAEGVRDASGTWVNGALSVVSGNNNDATVEKRVRLGDDIWSGPMNGGETVTLVWVSESGEQTEPLAEYTSPEV